MQRESERGREGRREGEREREGEGEGDGEILVDRLVWVQTRSSLSHTRTHTYTHTHTHTTHTHTHTNIQEVDVARFESRIMNYYMRSQRCIPGGRDRGDLVAVV